MSDHFRYEHDFGETPSDTRVRAVVNDGHSGSILNCTNKSCVDLRATGAGSDRDPLDTMRGAEPGNDVDGEAAYVAWTLAYGAALGRALTADEDRAAQSAWDAALACTPGTPAPAPHDYEHAFRVADAWRAGALDAGHGQPMSPERRDIKTVRAPYVAAYEMGYSFIHNSDVAMEMSRRIEALSAKWARDAHETDQDGDFCCALTRREREERESYQVLSRLSSWLGQGLGDGSTSAAEYERRIRAGVDTLLRVEASRAAPAAEWLRRDMARLLDHLYGLHFRPGHLDAVLDVIHLHALGTPGTPALAAEGLEQLEAKVLEFQRGTPKTSRDLLERVELDAIHKTLNVMLAEIAALRRVSDGPRETDLRAVDGTEALCPRCALIMQTREAGPDVATAAEGLEQTPLARALRRIAQGQRLSSLDVPVLEDAADELDRLAALRRVSGQREGWKGREA